MTMRAKTLCNLTLKETDPMARVNGPSVRVRDARENDRVLSQGWVLDAGALGLEMQSGLNPFGMPFTSKRNQAGSCFKVSVFPRQPLTSS